MTRRPSISVTAKSRSPRVSGASRRGSGTLTAYGPGSTRAFLKGQAAWANAGLGHGGHGPGLPGYGCEWMTPTREIFHWRSDGIQLTGERWRGDPGEETVVLLHGGGQTRHSWKRTADRLTRDGRTTLVLDARGHGDSDWHPRQDYALEAFVSDLVRLVDRLDRPPVLVGASLGGITSLAAAGEHPGLARGLVLVDIVVHAEPAGVARITNFMRAHKDGFARLEEVADAIAAYNPHRKRPTNLDGLRKNVRLHDDGRWYWHWDPSFMRLGREAERDANSERLASAAARINIPTLIVRGRQSDVVSNAGLAEMRRLIPHAATIDVGAAGHMVAGDDNDVFTAGLEQFLVAVNGHHPSS
jgi:pimeloyl-ACP methyl ester carboxylesterase